MANKLTPEEQATRVATRRATTEQSAQKVAEPFRPATDPQPADSETASGHSEQAAPQPSNDDPIDQQPAGDGQPEQAAEAAAVAETQPRSTTVAPDALTAKGLQILKEYPAATEVYMTSNGFGFFREQDARNHAATLRDKEVIIVKRK